MMNIGIIGAGTWGTALGILLCHNGHRVTIWSAFEEEIKTLNERREHHNLPGVTLPQDMAFTASMENIMGEKELLVLAVPSIYVRSTAKMMAPYYKAGQIVINVAKGIEDSTLMTLSQVRMLFMHL